MPSPVLLGLAACIVASPPASSDACLERDTVAIVMPARDSSDKVSRDTASLSLVAPPPALVADTAVTATADTVPVRRRRKVVAVEYSDWYARRLAVHRWASYTTLPLFVGNYVTGQQLLSQGNQAPSWAIRSHGPLAAAVATLFTVNSVTGIWNLYDGRHDPNGRAWRTTHAILMLVADAGFTTAGILSDQAERSDSRRRLHRTVALSSIGISLVSYGMMLKPFRHD